MDMMEAHTGQGVLVQAMTIRDVPLVLKLWDANVLESTGVSLGKGERDAASLALVQYVQSVEGIALTVSDQGRLLGYMLAQTSRLGGGGALTGEVEALYIGPEWRRRGLGSRLALVAQARLKELGACKIKIDMSPSNVGGMAFWGRQGFEREFVRYARWVD